MYVCCINNNMNHVIVRGTRAECLREQAVWPATANITVNRVCAKKAEADIARFNEWCDRRYAEIERLARGG